MSQPVGDPGADDHAEDDGIERELDQNAARRRNALGNRPNESLRLPVHQHAGGNKHQVINIQVQRRQSALRRGAENLARYQISIAEIRIVSSGLYSSHSPGLVLGSKVRSGGS